MQTTNYKYYIIPQARNEFRLAREWYGQQGVKGLSNRFARAVKERIISISQNPFTYAIRYKNVRVAHTDVFPYAIHYYLDEKFIIITAIIFQGRDPLIARARI